MSFLSELQSSKLELRPTQTTVKHIGGSIQIVGQGIERPSSCYTGQIVLLISKNWLVYQWLNPLIKKVLITSAASYDEMSSRLDAISGYHKIVSVDDFDSGMVEYHAVKLNEVYQFTHVACLSEGDLIRTSRLREMFGIEGEFQSVESALRYRDKFIMKTICKENGLSVPEFAQVESVLDVLDFTDKHGTSVVVKPRKGYGSVNTHIIKNEESLLKCIKSTFTNDQLDEVLDLGIEKFVNGQMYHIDGIVHDGIVKYVWPSQYINTVVNFEENPFIAGFCCSPENPVTRRLQEYIVNVIEALGGPSCFPFHAEAWHTDDNDIVLCEIASRGGGGGIKLQMLESSGIDMDKMWLRYQCGDYFFNRDIVESNEDWDTRTPHTLIGWVYIYPKRGTLITLPEECNIDYCVGYISYATNDTQFNTVESCFDAVAQVLVKGNTEHELSERIQQVHSWWESNTQWSC